MKTTLLLLAMSLVSNCLLAQWTTGTHIYNTNTGNVGIGTSTTLTPTAPLHLYGSLNGEFNLLVQNGYGTGNRTFLSTFPGKSSIQADKDFTIMTPGGGGWSDKFILTNVGYVGIGTTAPTSPLQVNGSVSELNILIQNTIANGARTYLTSWAGKSSIQTDKDFTIRTNPGGVWADKFVLTNAGNLGIGTTISGITANPNGYKLAVNGKIGAKEVQVENTSSTWADYVFESDYKLMPLRLVEDFVNTNKHLPEIPSAEEVKINGHKLGEMDVLLLKKIEELTLYIIAQEKKIESQDKKIETLEKHLLNAEK
jgi:hypothetical protein